MYRKPEDRSQGNATTWHPAKRTAYNRQRGRNGEGKNVTHLGHRLGALRDSVLGKFTWEDKADGSLDLTRGDR